MAHHEDRFCRRRPWSDFIREGGQLLRPRDLLIPTLIYRKMFYIEQRLHRPCKNLRFW
jgi:hypothetical protein